MIEQKIQVPIMADLVSRGEKPDYLFWVGCAGAYDERYKKVTRAFARLLTHMGISYAVLGTEETCSGDPARRAGNEMLFQMQALTNISTFEAYDVKKIITICPHCFNVFKNDYPDLGGNYQVIHHTQFLRDCMNQGLLKIDAELFKSKRITFHDPCYLGRANGEYNAPRDLLKALQPDLIELGRNRSKALCCGAGGAQMFKEAEAGQKEVFIERTEEAIGVKPDIVATACPFCMTMLSDGIKYKEQEDKIRNMDIAELIAESLGI